MRWESVNICALPPTPRKIMTYSIVQIKSFANVSDAWDYMDSNEYDFMDNLRFSYMDDAETMKLYDKQQSEGCCGYHDEVIIVKGRVAVIGCNYGH